MNRFFESTIAPILRNLDWSHIVEVGSDLGYHSQKIALLAKEKKARFTIIDPFIKYKENQIHKYYEAVYFESDLSLNVLKDLQNIDIILIDGDHNWYTVYHELSLIKKNHKHFPLTFIHDVSWPYGRRDLYYNPETIPDPYCHPYEQKGIHLETNELDTNGFNPHLYHSIAHNVKQCGVLTAIEDFCKTNQSLEYFRIEGFNGLVILYDRNLYTKETLISHINEPLHLKLLEKERITYQTKYQQLKRKVETLTKEKAHNLEVQRVMNEEIKENMDEMKKRLEAIQNEMKQKQEVLEEKNNHYKKEIARLKAELRKENEKHLFYKNELQIYQDSLSYKIGKSFVDVFSNPLKLFLLPYRLVVFFILGIKYMFRNYSFRRKPKQNRMKQTGNNKTQLMTQTTINGKKTILVDVIVCVHNALEDTKECLSSLFEKMTIPFNLIIVDDGSQEDTRNFLKSFTDENKITLLRNEEARGYTIAANMGLRISTGDYVVLLNSDTVVTEGWLEKMILCCEVDKETGIVGPLSNAASWQTVPEVLEAGDWKVNTLPAHINLDLMGQIVEEASVKEYPLVPFVNGFCFMISRKVIDTIGYLDEETFPRGYGEENDYCIRALDANFKLRIADNTYIFHEKSKSFTQEVRKQLSPKASVLLKQKHSKEKVNQLIHQIKHDKTFERIRERIIDYMNYFQDFKMLQHKKIAFILTAKGGGGGANSVVQEVRGLRKYGLDVTILNFSKYHKVFSYFYPDALSFTAFYHDQNDIVDALENYNYVVGTIFNTVKFIKAAIDKNPRLIPFYYAQDYEVLFFDEDHPFYQESYDSYTLINNNHLFAKTNWIINQIEQHHQTKVSKVKPSVDTSIYNPFLRLLVKNEPKTIISAMIRPSTLRRSPKETLEILRKIKQTYEDEVEIIIFGCTDEDLESLLVSLDFDYKNLEMIPSTEVRDVLLQSDIFIDLSTYQAFGRTGIEAMASACVPLLPIEGGVDEYAVNGYNALIVDTLDLEAVYQSLIGLIDDKALLHTMKMNGLNTVRHYNIRQAAFSEMLMFYKTFKQEEKIINDKLTIAYKISTRQNGCPTGSSYVRLLNPIHYIVKNHPEYQFIQVNQNTIDHLQFDVLFTHRQAITLNELNHIKAENIKIIYDLDDDLISDYPSLKQVISYCDLVLVTNKNLYSLVEPINPTCQIIPNYLDSELFFIGNQEVFKTTTKTEQKQYVCLGTSSHKANIDSIKDDILKFKSSTKYELFTNFETDYTNLLPIKVDNYPNFIKTVISIVDQFEFAIAVLDEVPFNSYKSYLKYLEYTGFGLPSIYSKGKDFDFNQVILDNHNGLAVDQNKNWFDILTQMTNKHIQKQIYDTALQDVLNHHLLESNYDKWLEEIKTFAQSLD